MPWIKHPAYLWSAWIYCALAGLAWGHLPGIWAVAPALLLPVLIPQLPWASERLLAALLYFMFGSFGIVHGSADFFGAGSGAFMGWSFWIVSSILLALPWLIARNSLLGVLAVLIDALPPLGLIGWLSPLAGTGVLFPGMSVYGVALLLTIWGLWSVPRWGKWIAVGSLAVALVANAISFYTPLPVTDGWVGLQTHTGELVTPLQGVESAMQAGQMALAHTKATAVVFPETIAGHWLPGTQAGLYNEYRQRQNKQQIWLVGAVTYGKTHRWDSVVEYAPGIGHAVGSPAGGSRQAGHLVAGTAFPVPVSMWAPWAKDRYGAVWYEPVQNIDEQSVFTSICYDQLLSWVWLEAVWQRPDVIVATSNVWWAASTDIPAIEAENTAAWARLMGAGAVMARNG
ncbi:TraB family protein [Acidithiobacillus ferrivorans SS3]|uniref:TraB family protein n=1 Tax=Acidithiobacillus ferrivorans SS3 TaxID=743299 RepID=G0JLL9_9PROT|nr:TraB family protein [Acidithiobacillus ferrivorans]AEM48068.1 TraB family protein [Acidithiobacillus ferrivorans SS3]